MKTAISRIPSAGIAFGTVAWVLLIGGLFYASSCVLRENYLFAFHAKATDATVLRKFITTTQGRHGQRHDPHIEYEFGEGATNIYVSSGVSWNTYNALALDGEMPVLYVIGNPVDNRIEMHDEIIRLKALTAAVVGGFLLAAIGGPFWLRFCVRNNRIFDELMSSGMRTLGTVSSIESYAVKGGRRYYLVLEFHDTTGRNCTGRSGNLESGEENRWTPGDSIIVRFDPRNSDRFCVDLQR